MLLNRVQVAAIKVVHSAPMAMLAVGERTGLVLDCGYSGTAATPVIELITLIHQAAHNQVGGRSLQNSARAGLVEGCTVEKAPDHVPRPVDEEYAQSLPADVIAEVVHHVLAVTPQQQTASRDIGITVPPRSPHVPAAHLVVGPTLLTLCRDFLFVGNDDGQSVATAVVQALRDAPLDTRRALVSSVVVAGGLSMIPGE